MEEYDIQSNWIRLTDGLPKSGERCIVTDGEVIVIATFVSDDNNNHWIVSGITENDVKSFIIQGWMRLPRQIK